MHIVTPHDNVDILSDLRPYQQVTISIAAINRLGHGPFSRSHNTTTAESRKKKSLSHYQYQLHNFLTAPSAPLLLVVKDNRALGTVLLSWSPPTMPNGILVGYEVFYNGYETPNEVFFRKFSNMTVLSFVIGFCCRQWKFENQSNCAKCTDKQSANKPAIQIQSEELKQHLVSTSIVCHVQVRALNGAGYGPNTSSELIGEG